MNVNYCAAALLLLACASAPTIEAILGEARAVCAVLPLDSSVSDASGKCEVAAVDFLSSSPDAFGATRHSRSTCSELGIAPRTQLFLNCLNAGLRTYVGPKRRVGIEVGTRSSACVRPSIFRMPAWRRPCFLTEMS